jgi:hypothetical protein
VIGIADLFHLKSLDLQEEETLAQIDAISLVLLQEVDPQLTKDLDVAISLLLLKEELVLAQREVNHALHPLLHAEDIADPDPTHLLAAVDVSLDLDLLV